MKTLAGTHPSARGAHIIYIRTNGKAIGLGRSIVTMVQPGRVAPEKGPDPTNSTVSFYRATKRFGPGKKHGDDFEYELPLGQLGSRQSSALISAARHAVHLPFSLLRSCSCGAQIIPIANDNCRCHQNQQAEPEQTFGTRTTAFPFL